MGNSRIDFQRPCFLTLLRKNRGLKFQNYIHDPFTDQGLSNHAPPGELIWCGGPFRGKEEGTIVLLCGEIFVLFCTFHLGLVSIKYKNSYWIYITDLSK
jgi:hypothetical protein